MYMYIFIHLRELTSTYLHYLPYMIYDNYSTISVVQKQREFLRKKSSPGLQVLRQVPGRNEEGRATLQHFTGFC